jgi:transcriptional regulator with XRE-family HTH domain
MGRGTRLKPERLAEKLLQIRNAFGLSQSDMLRRLGFDETLWYTQISGYELGRSVPPLPILLQYARVANVLMEVLADDELDLPETLPSPIRSEGIRRKSLSLSKSRKL